MIHLIIDGKAVQAEIGTTIMLAARQAGIDIPHLCEFEHLSPHGGCRMCVVEIEGVNTLQTSCTYPVAEGMVVHTNTEKVKNARKFVLSLLFSDRNHFCMVCPATNGKCELQKAAYDLEMDHWQIQPGWETYAVDSSHPWMIWDQSRCILCQRCVRACEELSGNHTIVPRNRGAEMLLTTDNNLPWGESSCVKCGTCLQVCPTGAIMDRRSAYWGNISEAEKQSAICVECGLGCSTEVYTRSNQILKIDGDWVGEVNRGVLCEIGRFKSVDTIVSNARIKTPQVKSSGVNQSISWEDAIDLVINKFDQRPSAAVISARQPIETLHSFKSLFEALGCEEVTSTENKDSTYSQILEVLDDPRQSVVSPDFFGQRGKANSQAAKLLGLTQKVSGMKKAVFLAVGDDLDIDDFNFALMESAYLVVAATYESELTEKADLVLPVANWVETGGHYLNLGKMLQENKPILQAPATIFSLEELFNQIAGKIHLQFSADWEEFSFDRSLKAA